jgi:hypothetical protein
MRYVEGLTRNVKDLSQDNQSQGQDLNLRLRSRSVTYWTAMFDSYKLLLNTAAHVRNRHLRFFRYNGFNCFFCKGAVQAINRRGFD